MLQFDILVIGGGPGGYSLAINAAKHGLKAAVFEKEHVGGTCLNVGCIPTKYLVDKAIAMEKVRKLVSKEIFRDAGSFSFQKIQKGKGEVTGKLVSGVQFLMKKNGVELVTGTAELKKDRVVACNGQEYQGKYVVIATGSVPLMIPVPGHEYCIDSTGALNLPKLPPRSTGTPSPRSTSTSPLGRSFKNCTNTTCRPLPTARTAWPTAAVVLPLPSPQYRCTRPRPCSVAASLAPMRQPPFDRFYRGYFSPVAPPGGGRALINNGIIATLRSFSHERQARMGELRIMAGCPARGEAMRL